MTDVDERYAKALRTNFPDAALARTELLRDYEAAWLRKDYVQMDELAELHYALFAVTVNEDGYVQHSWLSQSVAPTGAQGKVQEFLNRLQAKLCTEADRDRANLTTLDAVYGANYGIGSAFEVLVPLLLKAEKALQEIETVGCTYPYSASSMVHIARIALQELREE